MTTMLTFLQRLFVAMKAQEADLDAIPDCTLPIFTAFVPDAVLEHWTHIHHVVAEYHDEHETFQHLIVSEWRE